MTNRTQLGLLTVLAISTPALAQEPEVKPKPPALTAQQVSTIEKQLADVEKAIAQQRGGNLSAVLQKFRSAAASDAAALALYEDCEKLNADRKALTRDDKKTREEQIKKQAEKNKENKSTVVKEDGDFGTAVRLQLRYLILTLEAKDTKDMEKMFSGIGTYIQDVTSSAEKLKGRAGAYLANSLRTGGGGGGGGGRRGGNDQLANPFVTAFQLGHYLDNDKWSIEPLNFGDIFERSIFPTYRTKKKSELGAQWDARMSAESGYRRGAISEAEYTLWQAHGLLDIKWLKLKDLFENGDKPVNAMADMLAMIRENPSHPASPEWLEEFRRLVAAAAAAADGAAAAAPAPAQ